MNVKARLTCDRCSCVLAWDNAGPLCAPCSRASHDVVLAREGPPRVHRGVERADAKAAWDAGRLPAMVDQLGLTEREALEVAHALELLPSHLERRLPAVHRLLECADVGPQAAGRLIGVSRWTVTAWRRELGLSVP